MVPCQTILRHRRVGFSLIEAAIVLGVVGIVIGGIWVAAAKVQEERKITRVVEGLVLGVENLRSLVSSRDANPDGNGWTISSIRALTINGNLFPHFQIVGGKIQSPFDVSMSYDPGWGVSVGIFTANTPSAMTNNMTGNFVVASVVLPSTGICQRIAAQISSRYRDNSDLAFLWLSDTTNSIRTRGTWPISPTGTDCSSFVTPVAITLFYTMR